MKRGVALLGCALVLAGCGTKVPDHIGGGGGAGVKAAGPPAGGWPQPANGQLTTAMCGLLTDADYTRYGHERLPSVSQKRVDGQPNAVDCLYMTQDDLNLSVQPTAEAAKLAFAATLRDHKSRMTEDHRQSVLASNVVPGADESWFDAWTLGTDDSKFPEHEIQVRRGSLIVGIVLSGLKGKQEKDPREVLSGLAGLVLQRVPNVGRADTGVTETVRYTVTGHGRVKSLTYFDPASGKSVDLKNVRLPWKVTRPLVNQGQPMIPLMVNSQSTSPMAPIGCTISAGGRSLADERNLGFALCQGTYTPGK